MTIDTHNLELQVVLGNQVVDAHAFHFADELSGDAVDLEFDFIISANLNS